MESRDLTMLLPPRVTPMHGQITMIYLEDSLPGGARRCNRLNLPLGPLGAVGLRGEGWAALEVVLRSLFGVDES